MFSLALISFLEVASEGEVLGTSNQTYAADIKKFPLKLETETAFDQTDIYEYINIPYETTYTDNEELDYGKEEVLTEGVDGTKTLTFLLTHWEGEEINKQLMNTEIDSPVTEEISKGTKIVWREYMTGDVGGIWYWHKLRVWATKYDANCEGCLGRTYSGTEVKKGVCATDPNVIPLGTNFYVDRYGLCRAEDIGGAIKGNDVDLGFVDASKAAWGAEYTDVYLISNSPIGDHP
jgi:3D (Asp-Asp-Asp) domain-containing protein